MAITAEGHQQLGSVIGSKTLIEKRTRFKMV